MAEITIACVNWGNYCGRGVEYVNNLFDMVTRNLPTGNYKFQCFTDNAEGLAEGIEACPLPEGVSGWWNKLYLFKQGVFPAGERVIFFDLDTLITGPLDDLVKYDGDFAILRDFYHDRYGPGVMLWKAGLSCEIWDSYEKAGFPTDLPLGDLSWINQCFAEWQYKPDILQDLFPGQICSYKAHARYAPPSGVRVVCFHGLPRPHEAGGWVDEVWKVGGKVLFSADTVMNTGEDTVAANIRHSSALDLPWLVTKPDHTGTALIVGGSPSLRDSLEEIRARQADGQVIFATNGTYKYLIENGITPDYAIIIDARPDNVRFIEEENYTYRNYTGKEGGSPVTSWLFASQCAPEVFKAAELLPVTLVHMNYGNRRVEDLIPKTDKTATVIGGGNTVGLITISIARTLGFKCFHIFGMDSSYRENEHHAYTQDLNNNEQLVEVEAAGRTFICAPWMIEQAEQFQQLAIALADDDCTISVRGDGLLPYIAQILATPQEIAA